MGKKDHVQREAVKLAPLDEVLPSLPTCSIVVIRSSNEDDSEGRFICHVSLLVRPKGDSVASTEPWLFTPQTSANLPDKMDPPKYDDRNHPGAFLASMKSVLANVDQCYPCVDGRRSYTFQAIPLHGPSDIDEDLLFEELRHLNGADFSAATSGADEMKSASASDGQSQSDTLKMDAGAELVAAVYRKMGWINRRTSDKSFTTALASAAKRSSSAAAAAAATSSEKRVLKASFKFGSPKRFDLSLEDERQYRRHHVMVTSCPLLSQVVVSVRDDSHPWHLPIPYLIQDSSLDEGDIDIDIGSPQLSPLILQTSTTPELPELSLRRRCSWISDDQWDCHDWDTLKMLPSLVYYQCTDGNEFDTYMERRLRWSEDHMTLLDHSDDYCVWQWPDSSAAFVMCGTRPWHKRDLMNDMLIALRLQPARVDLMEKIIRKLLADGTLERDRLALIGHSLGGTLALLVGDRLDIPAIGLNAGGWGGTDMQHAHGAHIHIKWDPISELYHPQCYDKKIDLGWMRPSLAHSVVNFEHLSLDQI